MEEEWVYLLRGFRVRTPPKWIRYVIKAWKRIKSAQINGISEIETAFQILHGYVRGNKNLTKGKKIDEEKKNTELKSKMIGVEGKTIGMKWKTGMGRKKIFEYWTGEEDY